MFSGKTNLPDRLFTESFQAAQNDDDNQYQEFMEEEEYLNRQSAEELDRQASELADQTFFEDFNGGTK